MTLLQCALSKIFTIDQIRKKCVVFLIGTPMSHSSRKPLLDQFVGNPAVQSGYISLLGHVILGLLLVALVTDWKTPKRPPPLLIAFGEKKTDELHDNDLHINHVMDITSTVDTSGEMETVETTIDPQPQISVTMPLVDVPPLVTVESPVQTGSIVLEESASGAPVIQEASMSSMTSSATAESVPERPAAKNNGQTTGFHSRCGDARTAAVKENGGSAQSEQAVELGLRWLAEHQAVDGSWQFDLSGCRCEGACRHPGTIRSSTASTAIALLPFLGSGNTHVQGPYQQTVSRAIYYLISRMQSTPRGGDFCEGTMYGHGVTTMALAEAYGLAGDDMLVPYIQEAIRFIQTAQDQHSGGWRYLPGQAGDTTVTAWQLVALKSASLAGVETPSPTIEGVKRFLDLVQSNNGATYGYRTPDPKPCTSAIGLLCRMYTGWQSENEALLRGVTSLAKTGPDPHAVYQNFYLSQVLMQLNHPVWPRWNRKNREQLISLQSKAGHEVGSWFFNDPDTSPGGRLAHTALAVLTLEVYYRLLPIYTQKAVQDTF